MGNRRLSRLFRIVDILQSGEWHTSQSLARELGATRRTIFRDLRTLDEIGIDISFNTQRGSYEMPVHQGLAFRHFSPEELAAMVLCLRSSPYARSLSAEVRAAVTKLLAKVPEPVRQEIVRLTDSCLTSHNETEGDQQDTMLRQLIVAIRTCRYVRIRVSSAHSKAGEQTKLAPYALNDAGGCWRVSGRSSVHRKTCSFAVSTIVALEMLDDTFERPENARTDLRVYREKKLLA